MENKEKTFEIVSSRRYWSMAHGDGWKLWQQQNGNGGGLIFTLLQLILIITLLLVFIRNLIQIQFVVR